MAQSKNFGFKGKAKTQLTKGAIGTFRKSAKKTMAKNVRKGKGIAGKGGY